MPWDEIGLRGGEGQQGSPQCWRKGPPERVTEEAWSRRPGVRAGEWWISGNISWAVAQRRKTAGIENEIHINFKTLPCQWWQKISNGFAKGNMYQKC